MKRFLLIIITLAIASLALLAGRAYAASTSGPFQDVCTQQPDASVCQDVHQNPQDPNGKNSIYGPGSLLSKVTSLAALAVGVASVIMIIIGGIKFITSNGDSNNVNSARNTILYAVIGLVIAALAQTIVVFVLNKI